LRTDHYIRCAVADNGPVPSFVETISAIASRAATYDSAGIYPSKDLDTLREAGLLHTFSRSVEPEVAVLMNVLRAIGRANLSVGRIYEGHINGAKLIAWHGSAPQNARLASDVEAGHVFAVWATEAGVSLYPAGTRWRLEGTKTFATGAGHVDSALITARLPDQRKQLVWVRLRDKDGRHDHSPWQVRGMRATVSGSFDFSGMPVAASDFVGQPGAYEAEPRFTAGAWRFTAVQLGGVEALLKLLREHLTGSGAADDPIQRARFAEAVTATRSAALWVEKAAVMAEALDPDSVPLTLMTRGVVENAGLLVMETVARTIGTRAFFTSNPADRIARDLGLYLRQAMPDQARDRAALAWLSADRWQSDPLW
jgi:alkylation response protein AidB-like acyl-CoA dehydrogenase